MISSSHRDFYSWIKKTSGQVIPWTADLEYWIAGREQEGSAEPGWRTDDGYLELCRSLGVFPYYTYGKFWCGEPEYDETVAVVKREEPARISTTWKTPLGEISETVSFMAGSCSWAHTDYAVQDEDDAAVLEYLIEHRRMVPKHMDIYPQRLELWKNYGGLPPLALPRSPLAALFYEWAGVMNGVYLLMDCPDRMSRIFRMMIEQEQPLLSALAKLSPPLVHFADNVSGDNMSGYFDRYMREVYEERLRNLHDAGISCAVHLDGVINDIAGKLAKTGIDVLEALTPAPGGSADVREIRDLVGCNDTVLWGGLPGIMFSPPYTWDDIRCQIDAVVEAWSGSRFILGVADQVPADGDSDLVRKVSRYLKTL